MRKTTGRMLVMVSSLALATAAQAQERSGSSASPGQPRPSAPDDVSLTEIVVTARRVSENQQDVPVSLTVIGSEEIRRRDIGTATDLQRFVPSLNVTAGLNRNAETFSIRGQRETANIAGAGGGPAVVSYLAEAPIRAGGPGLFFDLANVQVLKGPQGTLFGQNTTGGAILLEPQRPTGQFEGYGLATLGSRGRRDIEGAINVPIVGDTLMARVGVQKQTRDGFTRDVLSGRRYDDRDNWTARASLLFRPSQTFENYTIGYASGFDDNGPGVVLLAVNPASPFQPLLAPYLAAQQARGDREVALGAQSKDRGRTRGVINRTTVSPSDTLTLTNIVSYTHYQRDSGRDEDGTVLPIQDSNGAWVPGTWNEDYATLTEELRLNGAIGDNLVKWQVGGFYDRTRPSGRQTYSQNLQLAATSSQIDAQQHTSSRAAFGQIGLDMGKVSPALEGLNLTAGYRYTWNRYAIGIDLLVYPGVLPKPPTPQPGDFCLAPPGAVYPSCTIKAGSRDEGESFAWGADYRLAPKVMVFGNFKRGYKTGGFNPLVVAYGATQLSPLFKFQPERVNTTELGIKSEWRLGGLAGRLNVTGYQSQYQDIQVVVNAVIPPLTASVIQNAARGVIRGVEIEGEVRPSRYFSVTGGYSRTNAHYSRYVTPAGVDLSDLPFVYTPKNQYNLAANLTLPFSDRVGEVVLRGTYSWQDKVYAGDTTPSSPFSTIPGYGLVGARLDWGQVLGNRNLDLSLFATNLANKDYRVSVIQQYTGNGYTSAISGEPRMYGVTLRGRF